MRSVGPRVRPGRLRRAPLDSTPCNSQETAHVRESGAVKSLGSRFTCWDHNRTLFAAASARQATRRRGPDPDRGLVRVCESGDVRAQDGRDVSGSCVRKGQKDTKGGAVDPGVDLVPRRTRIGAIAPLALGRRGASYILQPLRRSGHLRSRHRWEQRQWRRWETVRIPCSFLSALFASFGNHPLGHITRCVRRRGRTGYQDGPDGSGAFRSGVRRVSSRLIPAMRRSSGGGRAGGT